jgi:sulfite reductase alpha subunit-like flavoprotein
MNEKMRRPDHYDSTSEESEDEELSPEKVLVLFASETGNAQDTAERVGREIRRRGGRCTVQSMEDFDIVSTKDGGVNV